MWQHISNASLCSIVTFLFFFFVYEFYKAAPARVSGKYICIKREMEKLVKQMANERDTISIMETMHHLCSCTVKACEPELSSSHMLPYEGAGGF